jgi:hypothetical protein
MPDTNTQFLQAASSVMNELDIRYMEADLDDKVDLKDELDKAMMAFSEVRCKLLEREVVCTPEDVLHMQALRQGVSQAAEIQSIISIAIQMTGTLVKLCG